MNFNQVYYTGHFLINLTAMSLIRLKRQTHILVGSGLMTAASGNANLVGLSVSKNGFVAVNHILDNIFVVGGFDLTQTIGLMESVRTAVVFLNGSTVTRVQCGDDQPGWTGVGMSVVVDHMGVSV